MSGKVASANVCVELNVCFVAVTSNIKQVRRKDDPHTFNFFCVVVVVVLHIFKLVYIFPHIYSAFAS